MQFSLREKLHPLIVLEMLAVGIATLFFTRDTLLMAVWLLLLAVLQWRLHIRISGREVVLLLFGAAVWAALSYINHSHYSVLARDDIALWTFFHFTGILWYSVIVLRTTSLWTLITQLEGAGKRLLGPWLWIGQTALISVLAMRFIPVLRRNAHHLRADAKIRKRLAHNPLKWSDAFRFITPLVMLSIIHSEAVAEALWTRGWRPDIIPVAEKWTWSDTLVSVSLGFFLILAWKEKI